MSPISVDRSASGMNSDGRHEPADRVVPADQRFEAGHSAVGRRHQRLVVEFELLVLDRFGQFEFEHPALADLGIHAVGKEAAAIAAVGLGPVEREVGVAQQLVGARAVDRCNRDADGQADDQRIAVDQVGIADLGDHSLGQRRDGIRRDAFGQDDGEFVAAEARKRVLVPQERRQPLADFDQQAVADMVAAAVIDGLELVEIEIEQRERRAVPLQQRDRFRELLGEVRPVRQSGQPVMIGEVTDRPLGHDVGGDVGRGSDIADKAAFAEDGLAGEAPPVLLAPHHEIDLNVEEGPSLTQRNVDFGQFLGYRRSARAQEVGQASSLDRVVLPVGVGQELVGHTAQHSVAVATTTASRSARPHSPSAAARRDRHAPRPARACDGPAAWRGIRGQPKARERWPASA